MTASVAEFGGSFLFELGTLQVFELHHDGVDIAFLVQEDAGQPSDCFEKLFRDESIWRKFILDCFEVSRRCLDIGLHRCVFG